MAHLTDKLAMITGASRGIGKAVAKAFAAEGAHVILLARTVGGLEELDDEIKAAGGTATLVPMDLMKHEDTDKLGPSIAERFGKLDILVGNAGTLGPLTPAHQLKPKEWEKVMRVNVMANLRLIQTLDPLIRASDAGRMIFTTSGMAHMNIAYYAAYAASKAALNSLVQTYAAETLQTNMKVNLVSPGMVDTEMLRSAFPGGVPEETKKPEDVVPLYLDLAKTECTHHGEILSVE